MRALAAAATLIALAAPAWAEGPITVTDGYVRVAGQRAKSGAAFMTLANAAATDDRLIAARTGAAERAELHTHLMDAAGVMRMVKVEDGIVVPAGGTAALARGGDHVMLLGLAAPLAEGDDVALTLVFENAGEVLVELPVGDGGGTGGHGEGHGG